MNLQTIREIPRAEWDFFFAGFSRQYMGWRVTVEVFDEALGSQVAASDIAFEGISADAGHGDGGSISIALGGVPERHLSHTIELPSRVFLDQSGIERGVGEMLEIESEAGAKTLVRFHAPILPDQLDGLG